MLRWALRYLVVATAVAVVFAMLQGLDWARPEARQVGGERAHQRATNRQVDHDRGDFDDGDSEEGESDDSHYDESDSGELEQIIAAGPHGHFTVDAVVNGEPVEFMVDTGASHVVLTLEDARKLGFSASNLDFTHQFESANGVVRAAPVELREFRVGQFQLYDLEAFVNGGPLPISLLGMSFLKRLRSYEVARSRLVLRW
jgi:clan AA aspartic protease (TIGR02281 family)